MRPNETTPLPPEKEQAFREWLRKNKVTDLDHPKSFYDYRGAFLAGISRDPVGGHFPDTFKQHGHPTFSAESKYATRDEGAPFWMGETLVKGTPADAARAVPHPKAPAANLELLKMLGEIAGSVTPGISQGLSIRDIVRGAKTGDKTAIALGALGLLPLGSVLAKAGKGADIVAEMAQRAGRLTTEYGTARRALRAGEQLSTHGVDAGIKDVATRYGGHELPHVSKFIEQMAQHDPIAAENLKTFMGESKVLVAQAHGTRAPGGFTEFQNTRDIGYHVGTPGQATSVVERPNRKAFEQLRKQYEATFGGLDPRLQPDFYFWAQHELGSKQAMLDKLMSAKPNSSILAPLAVKAEHPLIVTDRGGWNPAEILSDIGTRGYPSAAGVTPAQWAQTSDQLVNAMAEGNKGTPDFWKLLHNTFGTDALQYLNVAEDIPLGSMAAPRVSGWSYILPKSNQIKSIFGNVGTFDVRNPDILRAVGATAGAGLLGNALLNRGPE